MAWERGLFSGFVAFVPSFDMRKLRSLLILAKTLVFYRRTAEILKKNFMPT